MTEDGDKIAIYYPAPTYQDEPEGRERKAELEAQLGLTLEETSVGTGADFPGLETFVEIGQFLKDWGPWAADTLVKGKDYAEAIVFYGVIAKWLSKYLKGLHGYVERKAASWIAVGAIEEHLGRKPKSLVLEGYMTGDWTGGGWDHDVPVTEINDPPPHSGSLLPHHFQFRVDGEKSMKAIVDTGGEVKIVELPEK